MIALCRCATSDIQAGVGGAALVFQLLWSCVVRRMELQVLKHR